MAFWNKSSTLNAAVDDWHARDLLDAQTAERLTEDIATQKSGPSFQSILILLAVISLGFGAITFVAANWEDIGRLTRVGIIFAAMWAAWAIAIVLQSKAKETAAQGFVLLACILFGAGIMLIGQIYHIQGEPKDAVWLWAAGSLLAAVLTRSVYALSLAIVLLAVWTFMDADFFGSRYSANFWFLAYLGLMTLVALWLRSRFAAHLIVITLIIWVLFTSVVWLDKDNTDFVNIVHYLSFTGLALVLFSDGAKQVLRGFERPLLAYIVFLLGSFALIWFVTALEWREGDGFLASQTLVLPAIALVAVGALTVFARLSDNRNSYDIAVTAVAILITGVLQSFDRPIPFVYEGFMLALSIWVIRMGWRLHNRPVTTLGFLGFAAVMTLIYFITIGTLLGTSAFYVSVGLLLLLGVFLAPRFLPKKEADK